MLSDRLRSVSGLLERAVVEVHVTAEALGTAADDGQHQGQAVTGGTEDGVGADAHADPGGYPAGGHPGTQLLLDERGSAAANFDPAGVITYGAPLHVTFSSRCRRMNRSSFSSKSCSYAVRS